MMKDILKGIALACVAAYLFGVLFMWITDPAHSVSPEIFLASLNGLLLTFWLFIPMGIGLGILIPRLFAGRSAAVAFFGGILLGFSFGLAGGLLLDFLSGKHGQNFTLSILMGLYCAPWTGVYAYVRRGDSQKVVVAPTQAD